MNFKLIINNLSDETDMITNIPHNFRKVIRYNFSVLETTRTIMRAHCTLKFERILEAFHNYWCKS